MPQLGLHCFHPCAEKIGKLFFALAGSDADLALRMEGSHVDFAPHLERGHSSNNPNIAKTDNSPDKNFHNNKKGFLYLSYHF